MTTTDSTTNNGNENDNNGDNNTAEVITMMTIRITEQQRQWVIALSCWSSFWKVGWETKDNLHTS